MPRREDETWQIIISIRRRAADIIMMMVM